MADRGFDRNLSYVALTRHRHRLALYVDRQTFTSGEQLRRVFAREPRKDLARDYRPPGEPAPNLEPVSLEPARDSWPPLEPVDRELTPERLERLRGAFDELERWDEIETQKAAAMRSRHALPYKGSLPDLDREIYELEQMPRHFDHDLSRVYRRPEAARAALEKHIRDFGPEAFERLKETPEEFGRLHGRQILGRPDRARAVALDIARQAGSKGVKRHELAAQLRGDYQAADRYRLENLALSKERDALAPDRGALVEKLRVRATGLDLVQLEGRLKPDHLKTLRDLKTSDRLHLRPLEKALGAFHRARKTETPQAVLWRLARNLSSLYRTTPRSLLRRLTPPQLRLLASAVSAAAAIMRKLAPEYEEAEVRRSILRP